MLIFDCPVAVAEELGVVDVVSGEVCTDVGEIVAEADLDAGPEVDTDVFGAVIADDESGAGTGDGERRLVDRADGILAADNVCLIGSEDGLVISADCTSARALMIDASTVKIPATSALSDFLHPFLRLRRGIMHLLIKRRGERKPPISGQ
jgi:hypothetical protein